MNAGGGPIIFESSCSSISPSLLVSTYFHIWSISCLRDSCSSFGTPYLMKLKISFLEHFPFPSLSHILMMSFGVGWGSYLAKAWMNAGGGPIIFESSCSSTSPSLLVSTYFHIWSISCLRDSCSSFGTPYLMKSKTSLLEHFPLPSLSHILIISFGVGSGCFGGYGPLLVILTPWMEASPSKIAITNFIWFYLLSFKFLLLSLIYLKV